ncbi:MAG: DUF4843 domain-containing protein [Pedobacter sp.]|nr:MAG: DUF4843 domain-containing protein [Pedobacter sp.]
MKRYIPYTFLLALLLFACKKNDVYLYDSETDNIYLHYLNTDGTKDTSSVTYSFATSPGLVSDTIWVPVSIAGKRINKARNFVVSVVDSMTTGIVGIHYEALKPSYVMPADSGKISIPFVVKNTDPELANTTKKVTLRIGDGGDFKGELPIVIRTKTYFFSNRLEQPSWWMYWQGNLGPYSRTTHRLFLISGGQDLTNPAAPNGYLGIPRTLYYIENAKNFVRDPFGWVARFPEKGYVLTKRTDGTEDYDFYQSSAPLIKTHLKFFPQVNGYFFISELGAQIIIN